MILSEKTGEIWINNIRYHLTKTEVKVIKKLNVKKIVTYEEIYYAVYGVKVNKVNLAERCAISTIVSRIKKKTGITINRYRGFGYELGGN